MKQAILSLLLFCCSLSLQAQMHYKTTSLQCPLAGTVQLQNCTDTFLAQVRSLEIHEPDENEEYEALMRIKEAQTRKYPYKASPHKNLKTTAPLAAPTVSRSFVADSNSGTPPDNYLAVSKNNTCVSVMNSFISQTFLGNGDTFLEAIETILLQIPLGVS
jgi:hypothetical protein